jgi:hypothetical protein
VSVAILKFHAGSTVYALAVDNVLSIGPARPGLPHLAALLGDATPSASGDPARSLRVVAGGHGVDLVVDGPVELADLDVDDIAPCRSDAIASSTILGFARDDDRVFVLLDAANLVELVRR